jgi:hypothetical protein
VCVCVCVCVPPAGVKDFVAWTDVVARVPELLQQIQVRLHAIYMTGIAEPRYARDTSGAGVVGLHPVCGVGGQMGVQLDIRMQYGPTEQLTLDRGALTH